MDDTADPLYQFFTKVEAETDDILYTTLSIQPSARSEEIKKAYRRLALIHHPDKHSSKSDKAKAEAAEQFQKIGFAYAVLSDEKRRKTYDTTGKTAESAFADAEEMGWDKYFETLFTRIDRKALDDDKTKYQDEEDDLIKAYEECKGSLPLILEHIPHATHDDEDRLVETINKIISSGSLQKTKKWIGTSTDKSAKAKRGKAASKQAKEAEEAAKELGVWDEFYGSGKKGKRQGEKDKVDKEGEGGLQALILKRQKDRSGALDAMAEKYAKIEEDEKARRKAGGKKRKSDARDDPGEMDDAAFEALQAKMFNKKDEAKKGKKSRT